MKRVAIYVRVSHQEQVKHGLSVDAQILALTEYAKEHDYEIVDIYSDAGISARKRYTNRPALLKLISDCKDGKIDLILFTKLDRWFRSVGDYYEVQRELENCGIPWRAIQEDYETETSSGIFKVNIMLSVAQSEADRTSDRIRSTFDYKRAKGDYIGDAPLGYMRKNNKLVKNPDEAHLVDIMFDTYIETHSSASVVRKLHEAGHPISRSTVHRLLSSETYRGNAFGFKCEPYLDEEKASLVDEIKKSNFRSPTGQTKTYLFPRLCVCDECGKKMRASAKSDGYKSYMCQGLTPNCPHINKTLAFSEKKIEKYLLKELDGIIADYNIEAETSPIDTNYEENLKKKKALEAKLERIGIRFEEGEISVEEYKEKRKATLSEIASLDFSNKVSKVELPTSWKDIYSELDEQHKQSFWLSIIKEIHLSKVEAPKIIFL